MSEFDSKHFIAFKIETEAEGASFHDIAKLTIAGKSLQLPVFVKVGGVEAAADVRACIEFGCDGIIAPMVESAFGVYKFLSLLKKYKVAEGTKKIITVETKQCIERLDEILDRAGEELTGITFGRTDLSGSYFDEQIVPDSDFILNTVYESAKNIKARYPDIVVTMGGSVSNATLEKIRTTEFGKLRECVDRVETRRVVLGLEDVLSNKDLINEALGFELSFLSEKKQVIDLVQEDILTRYAKLKNR